MASATSPLPLLPLHLPRSPLLSGSLAADFTATLIAQGICSPLPIISFSPAPASPPRIRAHTRSKDKPLPNLPIPPRQIISLLDLLEKMDNDVTKEVQRVCENVKEARAEVRAYKEGRQRDRDRRWADIALRKEKERRETKGPDDEFWLNA